MRDRALLGRTSLPACRASSRRGLRAARSLPAAHCVPVALRPEPAKPVRHGHGKGYSGGCGRSRPYCGRCKIDGPVSGSLGSRARAKYITIYHIRVLNKRNPDRIFEGDETSERHASRAARRGRGSSTQHNPPRRHRLHRVPGRRARPRGLASASGSGERTRDRHATPGPAAHRHGAALASCTRAPCRCGAARRRARAGPRPRPVIGHGGAGRRREPAYCDLSMA